VKLISGTVLTFGTGVILSVAELHRTAFLGQWHKDLEDDAPQPRFCAGCVSKGRNQRHTWIRPDHIGTGLREYRYKGTW